MVCWGVCSMPGGRGEDDPEEGGRKGEGCPLDLGGDWRAMRAAGGRSWAEERKGAERKEGADTGRVVASKGRGRGWVGNMLLLIEG